jgi:glyoxylase-like metal-dependent hydrolase (beta-lactamase superfamily II)
MMDIKIYPINTGFIRIDKGAYVTMGQGYGESVEVPDWAFLVTDGKEKILVDTGMSETERANWHHPGSYQPAGFVIQDQLKKLGVNAEEINTVIFTHLHWDHCSNMKVFKNAKYYVHSKEFQFALDPHVLYYKSYESKKLGVTPPFEGVEFETVEREYEYNSFVTVFPTPGHCPGHQSVGVKTAKGLYVIAGDAVFSEENLTPDTHRNLPFTPMSRYVNVFEMFESMEKIVKRANHVLPAHGAGVAQKPVYP